MHTRHHPRYALGARARSVLLLDVVQGAGNLLQGGNMSVRAKVRCNSVHDFGQQKTVQLVPVTGADGKGCEQWSKWTPSGEIRLDITNPDAFGQFEPGKFYLVDFTPTES